MSAWSIGATSKPAAIAESAAGNSQLKPFIDKLVAWIPGDVVMLYIAAVSAVGPEKPSRLMLGIAIPFAAVVVLLGNRSLEPAKRLGLIGRRAVLAAIATAVWTMTIPGSGWQTFAWIADNSKVVAVVAAALGLLFGLIASIWVPDSE